MLIHSQFKDKKWILTSQTVYTLSILKEVVLNGVAAAPLAALRVVPSIYIPDV